MLAERRMDATMLPKAQPFRDQQSFSVQHRIVRSPHGEIGIPILVEQLPSPCAVPPKVDEEK